MTNHAAETFSTKHRRFRIADRDTLRKFRSKNPLSGSLVLGLVVVPKMSLVGYVLALRVVRASEDCDDVWLPTRLMLDKLGF